MDDYHATALDKENQLVTTFITEQGHYMDFDCHKGLLSGIVIEVARILFLFLSVY